MYVFAGAIVSVQRMGHIERKLFGNAYFLWFQVCHIIQLGTKVGLATSARSFLGQKPCFWSKINTSGERRHPPRIHFP